jgi:hypothetical protein
MAMMTPTMMMMMTTMMMEITKVLPTHHRELTKYVKVKA